MARRVDKNRNVIAKELNVTGTLKLNGTAITATAAQINAIAGLSLSEAEIGVLDGVTPGTGAASKGLVLNSSSGITTGVTLFTATTLAGTTHKVGASGTAGILDIYPTTASKGKTQILSADNSTDTTTTIQVAAQAGAATYTIPDVGGSASFVMTGLAQTIAGVKTFSSAIVLPQAFCTVDLVTPSILKWVDVTVTAALLDAAGSVNVISGVAGDQYKIRHIRLVGGGTNFAAGGNRLIDLTDGTTVWTQIANADIESAPAATLDWGNAKVPFLTGVSDTASASNAAIRFQYSGGTTDHSATGSIKFSVCIEKVA